MPALMPGYSRRQFECFLTLWSFPKPYPLLKGGIALTAGDDFSPVMQEKLDTMNIANIHGLEEDLQWRVFEALVVREANARLGDEREPIYRFRHCDDIASFNQDSDGKLHWRLRNGNEGGGDWVVFVSAVFNLSRLDALATLAKMVDMEIENLWCATGKTHPQNKRVHASGIPPILQLPNFSSGSGYAQLMNRADILAPSGQLIGAILQYSLGGQTFCLPATVAEGRLCMGIYRPIACLLNQHLIDKYPGSTILFCQDMRTALSIQKLFGEVRGYDPSQFIVTAHLGMDLNILPWNYLHGHDVVFIPAPSKVSLSRIKLYKEYITGAHAVSFRVYPGFLLFSEPDQALKSDMEGITPGEAELLRNTVILKKEVENPLQLARKTAEKSMSYEDFKTWGENLGFFKKSKSSAEDVTRNTAEESQKLPPIELPEPNPILADVKCQHIFRPPNIVMFLGAKGAGKTQVALSCCRSLLTHVSLWSCFPAGSVDANSVCYMDAETPYDEYSENLKQHGLNNCPGFFGLSRFSPELPEFCSIFSLRDENFREGLYGYLLKNKCRYVFFDNLTALMGDEVHRGSASQIVLDWIERLQKAGVCVVLVHHKSEADHDAYSGRARGSQLFTIRARTIIELMGKNEIQTNKVGPDEVQKSVLRDGLTAGIRFNHCKPAPILDGKTIWAYLPLGGAEWDLLGATGADGQQIDFLLGKPFPAAEEAHSIPADSISTEDLHSLSSDELDVVQVLKNRPSKRAQIQEQLGWGEEKTQRTLKALVEKGIVVRDGGSRNTYYTLNNGK